MGFQISFLEVCDLPLNPTEVIGGTSAKVYKHFLRGKPAGVKAFKQQLSKKKVLDLSIKLRNVVRFRGYSTKPSALLFEYCVVDVNGELAHNLCQLISIFDDNEYFVFEKRLNYIIQATKGLVYLHRHNIVHKDFKPASVLVSGNLEEITVKVADFDDMLIIKKTIDIKYIKL